MVKTQIYGRKEEMKLFKNILASKEAEFLAIYGRRRVGKTFLIREYFSKQGIYFEMTGQKDGTLKEQLANFSKLFSNQFLIDIEMKPPKNWKEAFDLLTKRFAKIPKKQKCILFLDELPWLSSPRSNFLSSLDYYWNRHWSGMKNLVVIVCGSAASWMLDHLINAKGGLYNRLTQIIHLKPFSLMDTRDFLAKKGIRLQPKQLCDLYMVLGGIPHYLKQIQKGKSAAQNINQLCFSKEGLLYGEFDRLFHSLFDHSNIHYTIIKAIGQSPKGIRREDLIKKIEKKSGGTLKKRLDELEAAGFIQGYVPYGRKKKNRYYRIIDEYILFYLHWIAPIKEKGIEPPSSFWQKKAKTPSALSWAGFAFEVLCLKHVDTIQKELGIDGIYSDIGTWRYYPKKKEEMGTQIDLLFDRNDGVITICEIKYSDKLFYLDKDYAKKLLGKMEVFENHYPTKKQVSLALITLLGSRSSLWADEVLDDEVALCDVL